MNTSAMIDEVVAGKPPTSVFRTVLEDVSGPDRADLSPDGIASKFQELIDQSAVQVPYLNHDYVDQVLGQLRVGASAAEMAEVAKRNRDDYAAEGANIGTGDFETWDAIHQGLTKIATEALPPAA